MLTASIIGSLGMIAVESSYLPQILRLWRRKQSEDVSLIFPALNFLGRVLAISYAFSRHDDVFIVGLAVGIVLRATLLAQVAWYRRRRPSERAIAVTA